MLKENIRNCIKKILYVGVFCANENAKFVLENTQIMRCILCYQNPIIGINPRTQARK
jgi:hypothetical protein